MKETNFSNWFSFSAMSIAESSKFPGYGEETSNGSANSFTLSHSSSASSGFNSGPSHHGSHGATSSSRNSSFSQRAPLWMKKLKKKLKKTTAKLNNHHHSFRNLHEKIVALKQPSYAMKPATLLQNCSSFPPFNLHVVKHSFPCATTTTNTTTYYPASAASMLQIPNHCYLLAFFRHFLLPSILWRSLSLILFLLDYNCIWSHCKTPHSNQMKIKGRE